MVVSRGSNSLYFAVVALTTLSISAAIYFFEPILGKRKRKKRTINNLVRKNILSLSPYRCARDDYSVGVLLDANENSYGPALPKEESKLSYDDLELNRYPDPYQTSVKSYLSSFRHVSQDQIFVGVGSDEAIDLLIRIFCEPGKDEILITPPTYGMYKVCAKINNVGVQTASLTPEFKVDMKSVKSTITAATKMIFLCSPGNPTAVTVPLEIVCQLHDIFDGIIVVDEAYIDFSKSTSACSLVGVLERVVVLQTLSKAFGMAGIRMGMAYGSNFVIEMMNNVKAPYNVNKLSEQVACKALNDLTLYKKNVSSILEQRDILMETLKNEPYVKRVLHSDANFFLVEIQYAHTIYLHMAEHGVVVRFRGTELHCNDCLRITVGTPEQNEKLLAMLRDTVKGVQNGNIPLRE